MRIPLLLCLGLSTMLCAVESDQSLLQLPAGVSATIKREAAGHGVRAIERETEGGLRFVARIEQEGLDKYVTVAADGALVGVSDHTELNSALASGKQAGKGAWDKTKEVSGEAWDKTKEVASKGWEATVDTVHKATAAFKSDELTLNQVPAAPRATIEREAAGARVTDLKASSDAQGPIYHATIRNADGSSRALHVRGDGTLVPTP